MTNQDDLISRVKHAIYKVCLSEGNEDIFVKILDEINKLSSVDQKTKTEKVIKMRDATPEEREAIDKYIKSISKPTGVNFGTLEEALEYCDRNICIKNEYNGIGCDKCEVTKSQEPKILNTLDFAIDASNGETNYFVGFRNGLRYAKSLIDGEEEPQFESCTKQEPKTGHWIKSDIPNEEYVCSECGGCWYYDYQADVAKSRYCPNCGCRMVEPQESEVKE